MNDRPMLMQPDLVVQSLADLKDVTRRPAKDAINAGFVESYLSDPGNAGLCPYGGAGDRLWIREPFRLTDYVASGDTVLQATVEWKAGGQATFRDVAVPATRMAVANAGTGKWSPSIHMWRWASRLAVRVVSVRLERLHEITADDIAREGFCIPDAGPEEPAEPLLRRVFGDSTTIPHFTADEREAFARDDVFMPVWDKIYSTPHDWASDPWVWRIEYKRETTPP